jgi:hypothetical protein
MRDVLASISQPLLGLSLALYRGEHHAKQLIIGCELGEDLRRSLLAHMARVRVPELFEFGRRIFDTSRSWLRKRFVMDRGIRNQGRGISRAGTVQALCLYRVRTSASTVHVWCWYGTSRFANVRVLVLVEGRNGDIPRTFNDIADDEAALLEFA